MMKDWTKVYVIMKHDRIKMFSHIYGRMAFDSRAKAEKLLETICEYNCEYGSHYKIVELEMPPY